MWERKFCMQRKHIGERKRLICMREFRIERDIE